MRKKKHQFHCNDCYSPCEIYRKGKHRVLVCPKCGILATNPIPLLGALGLGSTALSVGKSLIGKEKTKKTDTDEQVKKIVFDSLDKPNKNERYVNMALKG